MYEWSRRNNRDRRGKMIIHAYVENHKKNVQLIFFFLDAHTVAKYFNYL